MWVDIKGWEGIYELNENGEVRNKATGRYIVGDKNSSGYMRVCLYKKGHFPSKKRYFRHRLVAEHFIPNPDNLPEVNHKNCNVLDNSLSNLEWSTRVDNERHSHTDGKKLYRGYCVEYENGTRASFVSCSELAEIIGVTRRSVVNWLHGDNYGYKQYGISKIFYRDSA